nr:PREDICTED: core-binding factor subunit beta [Opisthocomus hoazin]
MRSRGRKQLSGRGGSVSVCPSVCRAGGRALPLGLPFGELHIAPNHCRISPEEPALPGAEPASPATVKNRLPGSFPLAFVATGTNLSLQFFPASWQGEQRQTPTREYVDFEREGGKVYLKAPMILNGVCVIWKGWIDLQRLDGMGCLEFDEERAQQEDALAQQAFEEARRRTREFEDRDRSHREEMEARRQQDPSPGSNLGSGDDLKLR